MIDAGQAQDTVEPHTPVEVGEARMWNESMLGWWYDEAAGVFGFHRIGHLPNDNQAQICHTILTHDGRRYRRNTTLPFNPAWRTERWRTEGLEAWFDKGWDISYESPECSSRLTFEDYHPPVDTAKLASKAGTVSKVELEKFYHGHIEAGCRVTGTVVIDGETIDIDGLGFRDHSWNGIRDMSAILSTRWVVGTCGPQLSFGMSYCSAAAGEVMRNGWVYRNGVLHAVKAFDCLMTLDMDGRSWRRGEAWAELDDGSVLEIKSADTWDGVVIDFDRWTSFDAGTSVTVNGLRGVIDFEISNNPFGGYQPITNAARACATDGLTRRPAVVEKPTR